MNQVEQDNSNFNSSDYGSEYAEQQLARSNNPFRRLIKGFYLRNLIKDVNGRAVDFGCGAGQILELLPEGSIGFEANTHLVQALKKRGTNAHLYDPEIDQLNFKDLAAGEFSTLVMSHVLEHFENADEALKTIFNSCKRLGIKRVIIVVPGKKGYLFDKTHRTFIDRAYLESAIFPSETGFAARTYSYFPINIRKIGDYFAFHELKVVFDLQSK